MKEGSPYEKKQGGEGGGGEELKTCSWWVTRGCNYRDVRGRVLSQSASARSVSEPPRKRGFAPAGRIFNRVLNKESLSTKREREREEDLAERRLRILAWMPRKRACARVLTCFVCRETSCLSFVSSRIIVSSKWSIDDSKQSTWKGYVSTLKLFIRSRERWRILERALNSRERRKLIFSSEAEFG